MNKDRKKSSALAWYYKNRERQIQKNREWKLNNRLRMLAQKKEYHLKNKERINQHKKEYRKLHPEKMREYRQRPESKIKARTTRKLWRIKTNRLADKIHYQKYKDKIRERNKIWSQRPEVKARRNELARINRRNNPRSNRSGSIDMQLAMNSVRKRDKNTCQWQGCGKTFREVSIHVHHIFPRSEYPELELVEQYMICYCGGHHGYWHRMRGDKYSEMIPAMYQERGIVDYIRSIDQQ